MIHFSKTQHFVLFLEAVDWDHFDSLRHLRLAVYLCYFPMDGDFLSPRWLTGLRLWYKLTKDFFYRWQIYLIFTTALIILWEWNAKEYIEKFLILCLVTFQVPEMLHSVSPARIFSMRQQTQMLWSRYLSSVDKIVDTTFEVIWSNIKGLQK